MPRKGGISNIQRWRTGLIRRIFHECSGAVVMMGATPRGTARTGSAGAIDPSRVPRGVARDRGARGDGWRRILRHYLPVLLGLAGIALAVILAPSSLPPTGEGVHAAAPLVLPDPPNSPGVAVSGVHCGNG